MRNNLKREKYYFSLVIPTLNEEEYLPKLLDDLGGQTYQNFEIIVVDGKSKDGTILQAKKFGIKRNNFRLFTSSVIDLSVQRNFGAEMAKGNWLVFCDADNRLGKNFLFDLKNKLLKYTDVALFSCGFKPDVNSIKNKLFASLINFGMFLSFGLNRPTPTVLIGIKKKTFEKVGGFRPGIFAEDLDFGLRVRKRGIRSRFFSEVKYIYCFRRFRRSGIFPLFFRVVSLNLKNLLRIPYDIKKEYPMGGTYF